MVAVILPRRVLPYLDTLLEGARYLILYRLPLAPRLVCHRLTPQAAVHYAQVYRALRDLLAEHGRTSPDPWFTPDDRLQMLLFWLDALERRASA